MAKKRTRVEIAIPIYNEQAELKTNTLRLRNFLRQNLTACDWRITIVDNSSSDRSGLIAKSLTKLYPEINYLFIPQKGRGRAVKCDWQKNTADVYSYMDIDLSTDLSHFPRVVNAINQGYDVAIGSRLLSGSKVEKRPLKREIMSRGYNFLLKLLFQTHFSDAQCGFKAVSARVVDDLIPHITDNEWFFDSELLILSEKIGYRIYEEPVIWVDNPGSTVKVLKTVTGDIMGLWRLFWTKPWLSITMVRS